jgi:hypothetical protein
MSTFKPDYAGLSELLNSDAMVAAMVEEAAKVMSAAESTAPVATQGDHPGRYKASFSLSGGKHGGIHSDRAFGRVTNDAPEAVFVEFGSKNNPKYRTLGHALDAAGQ